MEHLALWAFVPIDEQLHRVEPERFEAVFLRPVSVGAFPEFAGQQQRFIVALIETTPQGRIIRSFTYPIYLFNADGTPNTKHLQRLRDIVKARKCDQSLPDDAQGLFWQPAAIEEQRYRDIITALFSTT